MWVLLFSGVAALFGFSIADQKNAHCWKIEVAVEQMSGLYFIDEASVLAHLNRLDNNIIGTHIDSLSIAEMHEALMLMPSVKSADVYSTVDGVLHISIQQRKPLFRIFNRDGSSFYVDIDGRRMPLSDQYTARVPVLAGNVMIPFNPLAASEVEEAQLQEAIQLFEFIANDPLWRAQTEHIAVNEDREFELIPRVGTHRILLGNASHLNDKFARLRSFYDAMVHTNDLNKYKRINLKFRNQVVCERFF
jgi:cell division protein FtsQ